MTNEIITSKYNWQTKKLGEVCEVVTGTTPPKKDADNYGNDVPFFKPPHLWDCEISTTDEMLSLKGAEKARVIPKNSVLVTCIGNLGRTGFLKCEAAFNQQINAIIENEEIIGKFIFYLSQSPDFRNQLERLATGTTVSIVNKKNFETIEISYPDLTTQHLIVSKIETLFSELDQGIAELKKAQEQLKTYRQSVLKYAFEGRFTNPSIKEGELPKGWEWKTLKNIGKIETGTTPSKKNPNYYGTEYPFYKPTDLGAGINTNSSIDGLTKLGVSQARYVPEKSILVTCIGATIGKTGLIRKGGGFNQQINAIIPFENINPFFVYYQVISSDFQNQILNNASATTLPILNKSKFQVLEIKICPFQEQHLIVQEIESRLSVADKMAETISESLQKAEALRQSILKKAFSGELV